MELTNEVLNTIIIVLGLVVGASIMLKSPFFQSSVMKKQLKIRDSYTNELEDELDYYKKKLRSEQLKANAKDRGPVIQDGDWESIVPSLVEGISPYLPKKLQPLFKDKEISGAIMKEVLENPEKYKDTIKGFISKGTGKSQNTQVEAL